MTLNNVFNYSNDLVLTGLIGFGLELLSMWLSASVSVALYWFNNESSLLGQQFMIKYQQFSLI